VTRPALAASRHGRGKSAKSSEFRAALMAPRPTRAGSPCPNVGDNSVRVYCRVRPSPEQGLPGRSTAADAVAVVGDTIEVVSDNKGAVTRYSFDGIFGPSTQQAEVYETAVRDLVEGMMQGFDGALLCYGQTGGGKTFTLEGSLDDAPSSGMLPRAAHHVFEAAEGLADVAVTVSFIEIYLEKVQDLLGPQQGSLAIRELDGRGPRVQQCREIAVTSPRELLRLARAGAARRSVAATRMNCCSSRSHSIFSITVTHIDPEDGAEYSGTLHLVDLAGSERQPQTRAEGRRLDEARTINRSLSVLGDVIAALASGSSSSRRGGDALSHVPYRNSKLTQLLREALGGNSRAVLVLAISPAMADRRETLSSLRFGSRAKCIENQPVANVVVQPVAPDDGAAAAGDEPEPEGGQLEGELRQLYDILAASGSATSLGSISSPKCFSSGGISSASTRTASTSSLGVCSTGCGCCEALDRERLKEALVNAFGGPADARRLSDHYGTMRQQVTRRNAELARRASANACPDRSASERRWQAAVVWDFTSERAPRLRAQLVENADCLPGECCSEQRVVLDLSAEEFATMPRAPTMGWR